MTLVRLGAALLLAFWSAHPGEASAGTVKVGYSVSLMGLPVGSAKLKADLEGQQYTFGFSGKVRGLMRLFSDADVSARAAGTFDGDMKAPTQYDHRFTSNKKTETVAMRFLAHQVEDLVALPPRKHPERYLPVTAEQTANVLDPLSALVQANARAEPASCDRTLPIFDGRERFDLALRFSRSEAFALDGLKPAAPVVVCAIRYIPISGHQPDKKSVLFMQNNEEIEIWLAAVGSALLIPVQLRLRTEYGMLAIVAQHVTVG